MKSIKSVFKKEWKNIHPNFTEESKREWREKGFDYNQVKEWIDIGLTVNDADYARWLKNSKGIEWVSNHGNIQELRKEYNVCLSVEVDFSQPNEESSFSAKKTKKRMGGLVNKSLKGLQRNFGETKKLQAISNADENIDQEVSHDMISELIESKETDSKNYLSQYYDLPYWKQNIINNELIMKEIDQHLIPPRNILIIGRIGSGKSALANLLLNEEKNFSKWDEFQEIFEEGRYSVSETRNTQSKEIEINRIKYRIIDTIGFGYDKLTDEEMVTKLSETCREIKDGLSQILFVVGGRFSQSEIKLYSIIRKRIFSDDGITKCTTIVRTKFPHFQDGNKCKEDLNLLKKENKKFSDLIDSCDDKVIYINNPSLSFNWDKGEEQTNKEIKKSSRDKLVKHLESCQDIYKSENLELIVEFEGKYENLNEVLEEKRGEIENKSSSVKFIHKANKELGLNKISREKSSSTRELEIKETEESLFKAVIEIRDICKQM